MSTIAPLGWVAPAAQAQPCRYDLAVPAGGRRALAFAWLAFGIAALAASGVFSLLLVAARTPGVKELFPAADFFRVALVAHVDLSVLVWFLAFAAMMWNLAGGRRAQATATPKAKTARPPRKSGPSSTGT